MGNSEAALDNRDAMRGMARDIQDITVSTFKQTGSVQQSMAAYASYRDQLTTVAQKFFSSREEAQAYVDTLLRVPPSVLTQMATSGIPEAQALLAALTAPKTVEISLALKKTAAESNKPWEQELTDKADWAGGLVGESFAKGIGDEKSQAETIGREIGKAFIEELKAAGVIPTKDAGKTATTNFAGGMTTGTPSVTSAATSIANAAYTAIGSVNFFAAGTSIVSRLTSGIYSMSGPLTSAANWMAGIVGKVLPKSPAESGPLSGAGDPLRSAMGMLRGESHVESAAWSLAQAARISAPYYGFGDNSWSMPGLNQTINVHVGNEQLDAYIVESIDDDNEALARTMLTGRSGVG